MKVKSKGFSGATPTSASRSFSMKLGYQRYGRAYPTKWEIFQAAARTQASKQCSECGAPALRIFGSVSKGFYGRCKVHISGGEVPYSYKSLK